MAYNSPFANDPYMVPAKKPNPTGTWGQIWGGVKSAVGATGRFLQGQLAQAQADPAGGFKTWGHVAQNAAGAIKSESDLFYHDPEAYYGRAGQAIYRGVMGSPQSTPDHTSILAMLSGDLGSMVHGVYQGAANKWNRSWDISSQAVKDASDPKKSWTDQISNALGLAYQAEQTTTPISNPKQILSSAAQIMAIPQANARYYKYLKDTSGQDTATRWLIASLGAQVASGYLFRAAGPTALTEEELAAAAARRGETPPEGVPPTDTTPNFVGRGIVNKPVAGEEIPFGDSALAEGPVTTGEGITQHPDLPMLANASKLTKSQFNEMGQTLFENFTSIDEIKSFYQEVYDVKVKIPKTLQTSLEDRWRLDRQEAVGEPGRQARLARAQARMDTEMTAEHEATWRDAPPDATIPDPSVEDLGFHHEFHGGTKWRERSFATTKIFGKYVIKPPLALSWRALDLSFRAGQKLAPAQLLGYSFAHNLDPKGLETAIKTEPGFGQQILGLNRNETNGLSNVLDFFYGSMIPDPLAYGLNLKTIANSAYGFAGPLAARWGGLGLRTPEKVDEVYRQSSNFRGMVSRFASMNAAEISTAVPILRNVADRLGAAKTPEAVLEEIKNIVNAGELFAPEGVIPKINLRVSERRLNYEQKITLVKQSIRDSGHFVNPLDQAKLKALQTGYALRNRFLKMPTYLDIVGNKMNNMTFRMGIEGRPAIGAIMDWLRIAGMDERTVLDTGDQLFKAETQGEWSAVLANMHKVLITNRVYALMPGETALHDTIASTLIDKTRGMFGGETIGRTGSYSTGDAYLNDGRVVQENDADVGAAINAGMLAPGHIPPVNTFNRMLKGLSKSYRAFDGQEEALRNWTEVLRADPVEMIAMMGDIAKVKALTPNAMEAFLSEKINLLRIGGGKQNNLEADIYEEVRQIIRDVKATHSEEWAATGAELAGNKTGLAQMAQDVAKAIRERHGEVVKETESLIADGQFTHNYVNRLEAKIGTLNKKIDQLDTNLVKAKERVIKHTDRLKRVLGEGVEDEKILDKIKKDLKKAKKEVASHPAKVKAIKEEIAAHQTSIDEYQQEFDARLKAGEISPGERPGDESRVRRNIIDIMTADRQAELEQHIKAEEKAQTELDKVQAQLKKFNRNQIDNPPKSTDELEKQLKDRDNLRKREAELRQKVTDSIVAQRRTGYHKVPEAKVFDPTKTAEEHPFYPQLQEHANNLGIRTPDPAKPFDVPKPEVQTIEEYEASLKGEELKAYKEQVRQSHEDQWNFWDKEVDTLGGDDVSQPIPQIKVHIGAKWSKNIWDRRVPEFEYRTHPMASGHDDAWWSISKREREFLKQFMHAPPRVSKGATLSGTDMPEYFVEKNNNLESASTEWEQRLGANAGTQTAEKNEWFDKWREAMHNRAYHGVLMAGTRMPRYLQDLADSGYFKNFDGSFRNQVEDGLVQTQDMLNREWEKLRDAHGIIHADIEQLKKEVAEGKWQPWPKAKIGAEPQDMSFADWHTEVSALVDKATELNYKLYDEFGPRTEDRTQLLTPAENRVFERLDELIPRYIDHRIEGLQSSFMDDAKMIHDVIVHAAKTERFGEIPSVIRQLNPDYVRRVYLPAEERDAWQSPEEIANQAVARRSIWDGINHRMTDLIGGIDLKAATNAERKAAQAYEAAQINVKNLARDKIFQPALKTKRGKIGDFIFRRADNAKIYTNYSTVGQASADVIDHWVNDNWFKPMALFSAGYAQRVGISEAFLNAARFGPMQYMDAALKSASARGEYRVQQGEVGNLKAAWYGLVSGISEPLLEKHGAELAQRALELLTDNDGHIASGVMNASHGVVARSESEDFINGTKADLSGQPLVQSTTQEGVTPSETIVHDWAITLSQRASDNMTVDIAQKFWEHQSEFVTKGVIDPVAAEVIMTPIVDEMLRAIPKAELDGFARSRLNTRTGIENGLDPIQDWAGVITRDLINLISGSETQRFYRPILKTIAEGGSTNENFLGKLVLGRDAQGELGVIEGSLPANLPHFEDASAAHHGANRLMRRITDAGQRRMFAPIVNTLARNPTYLLEYTKEMRTLQPLVDAGEMTADQARVLAQTRGTYNMAKYVHNPQDRTRFEQFMRVVAPFYFAQNQAFRRAGRLLESDPAAFEYYYKNMFNFQATIGTATVNGIAQMHIPGSQLMGAGVAMALGMRGWPIGLSARVNGLGSVDPLAEGEGGFNPINLLRPHFGPVVTIPLKVMERVIFDRGLAHFLPESWVAQGNKAFEEALGPIASNTPIWTDLIPNTLVRNIVIGAAGHQGLPGGAGYADAELTGTLMAVESDLSSRIPDLKIKYPSASNEWIQTEAAKEFALHLSKADNYNKFLQKVNNATAVMWTLKSAVSFGTPVSALMQRSGVSFAPKLQECIKKTGSVTLGYALFNKLYPDHTMDTVFKTNSPNGSWGPTTTKTGEFIQQNMALVNKYPKGIRYFMPSQDFAGKFDPNTFHLEKMLGIKATDTPREFLDAIMVSMGKNYESQQYEIADKFYNKAAKEKNVDPSTYSAAKYKWVNQQVVNYATKYNPIFLKTYSPGQSRINAQAQFMVVQDMLKDKEVQALPMYKRIKDWSDAAQDYLKKYNITVANFGAISKEAGAYHRSWKDYLTQQAKENPAMADFINQVLIKL